MSVVLIPLFGVDVPASSEGIRLSSEVSGTEVNDKVELGEELRPAACRRVRSLVVAKYSRFL